MLWPGGWSKVTEVGTQLTDLLGTLGVFGQADGQGRVSEHAVATAGCGIVIADALRPGQPVLSVNAAFERMTGYASIDVIGKSCRFLQGPDTDPETVDELRQALHDARTCTVTLLNYRKDGTAFWNELTVAPVRDAHGAVTHWIASQLDVTAYVRAAEERRKLLEARTAVERERGQVQAVRQEASELKGTIAKLEERVASLQQQVVEMRRTAEAARLEAAHARLDTDAARAMLAETRAALERAHVALATAQGKASAAQASVDANEQELATAREQASTARSELSEAQRALATIRDQVAASRSEVETLRAELHAARSEASAARDESSRARAEAQAATSSVAEAPATLPVPEPVVVPEPADVVARAVARVAHDIVGIVDPQALLDRLAVTTCEVLGATSSATLVLPETRDALVVVSCHGAVPSAFSTHTWPVTAFDSLIEGIDPRTGATMATAEATDRVTQDLAELLSAGTITYLPLRRGTSLLGVQALAFANGTRPDPDVVEALLTITARALAGTEAATRTAPMQQNQSEFVYTISHEIRTPLNVILGYQELLLDGGAGPLTAEQRETLHFAHQAATSLCELLNTTLDLSKLDRDESTLSIGEVDLGEVLRALAIETCELQNKANLQVDWAIPDPAPVVTSDPMKIRTIVKHLLTNAVKFTDAGRVTVAVTPRVGGVEISVTDTGVGIPAESLPVIFEPFRQVDGSHTRHHDGAGLGLYVVRRTVDLLGGTVDVASKVGQGSTFRVRLPLVAPAVNAAPAA